MDRNYVVTLARFHRQDMGIYIVQGYFQGNSIAGCRLRAYADSRELPVEIQVREGLAIRQKYITLGIGYENIDREYDLLIQLPQRGEAYRQIRVCQEREEKRTCVFRISAQRLRKEKKRPDGYLETWHASDKEIAVGGWAVGSTPCRIQVQNSQGEKVPCQVTWHYRQDIVGNYPELGGRRPEELRFGFEAVFPRPQGRKARLVILADGQRMEYVLDLLHGEKNILGGGQPLWKKGTAYLKRNGLRRTLKRCGEKLRERTAGGKESYMSWRRRHLTSKEELQAQSRHVFLEQPLISVVVPLYNTPERYLRELCRSIQAQTYAKWELCLADGSPKPAGEDGEKLREVLRELSRQDRRIRVVTSERALGISENTNAALEIARGDWMVFADHDDLLPENALYEVVRAINEHPEAELIYSDEDKVSMDGKTWFEPHFKSDFNIDLLCSMNYICHLTAVSAKLLAQTGPLDPAFDGAQDYDLILRCVEKTDGIVHIPRVLYHWRSHWDSTSANPESKRYAFEAGQRAVQAHYDRLGIAARVLMGEYPGLYRTEFLLPEKKPLVSVIIPNKDHIQDLEKCVNSLLSRSSYPELEIIIAENNSTLEETFAWYRKMELAHKNVRVVCWEKEFNYSAINNFAAAQARGEYLLLLNNDTEMIDENAVEEMVGPCLREEVGIVGARLFYPDQTIQHAGVIIGYGGIAGHAFQGFDASANGYFSRIICMSDLSAVTAACMLVRKSLYEELGGLDETFRVAFNDIDFCLRAREKGKLVVYQPYARWFHYESKSRGYEDTPEKIARFNSEADRFLSRWPRILSEGDPYYNPNLSLNRNDFSLKG